MSIFNIIVLLRFFELSHSLFILRAYKIEFFFVFCNHSDIMHHKKLLCWVTMNGQGDLLKFPDSFSWINQKPEFIWLKLQGLKNLLFFKFKSIIVFSIMICKNPVVLFSFHDMKIYSLIIKDYENTLHNFVWNKYESFASKSRPVDFICAPNNQTTHFYRYKLHPFVIPHLLAF